MALRLKYVGPHDEVECLGVVVKRGDVGEFPDEATDLLDQPDNWQPVKVATTKKEG